MSSTGQGEGKYAKCGQLLAGLFLMCSGVSAQETMRGPWLGWVVSGEGLYRLLGVPGAAIVEHPGAPDVAIERAVAAPGGEYVLLVAGQSPRVRVAHWAEDGVEVIPFANEESLVGGLLTFSQSGGAVAWRGSGSEAVFVYAGLPSRPRRVAVLDTSFIPGLPAGLAVSDDGRTVFVATARGELWRADSDSDLELAARFQASPLLALTGDGSALFVAESAGKALYRVVAAPARESRLLFQDEILSRPVALALSADGRRLFAAVAEPPGILALNLATQEAYFVASPCAPTGLNRLRGNALFRLTDWVEKPLWLYDGDNPSQPVSFVPSLRGGN